MKDKELCERLIYLDSEFISRLYEFECNVSPQTSFSRTTGIEASASIPFFSGGGNSSETRTYKISSLEMLNKLRKRLERYPNFKDLGYKMDSPSTYCWIYGTLGITKIKVRRTKQSITFIGKSNPQKDQKDRGNEELVGEEAYFNFEASGARFALSPTDQYFVSGVAAFKGLAHLLLDRLSLPSRALIRVFSANTSFDEWIATPLIIYDID